MEIKFEVISRMTEKAVLLARDEVQAWIPKSSLIYLDEINGVGEVKEGFQVQWKDNSGRVIETEGISNYGDYSGGNVIKVASSNLSDLWEYI